MPIQQLNLEINNDTLPTFKVTALGDSGAGKTIFMSAMYTTLQQNEFGVRIRADDKTNLEMQKNFMNVYTNQKFPVGTTESRIEYLFELLFDNKPIALIDWVDYRGGAVHADPKSEEATALKARIMESHCLIWMLDLNKLKKINAVASRGLTSALTMSNLTLDALDKSNSLRSVIFLRSKSDAVRDANNEVDWEKACNELEAHLGNLRVFSNIKYTALIPISSCGRIDLEEGKIAKFYEDEPHNTEWALILALAFMLEKDLRDWSQEEKSVEQHLKEVTPNSAFRFLRELSFLKGKTSKEANAGKKLSELAIKILGMSEVFERMLKEVPSDIKIFLKD